MQLNECERLSPMAFPLWADRLHAHTHGDDTAGRLEKMLASLETGTTEEKAREEYRGIAERRVRLGLVIAEIGERNQIKVTDEELSRAVMERARQMPGSEQKVWDFYQNNPNALASLRAPIFEDKVVDFLLELAEVSQKTVSREELYKEDEV
jgi:trigger factor